MAYENAVSIRLSKQDKLAIEKLVEEGYAMSPTDFVRAAVREKVARTLEARP